MLNERAVNTTVLCGLIIIEIRKMSAGHVHTFSLSNGEAEAGASLCCRPAKATQDVRTIPYAHALFFETRSFYVDLPGLVVAMLPRATLNLWQSKAS